MVCRHVKTYAVHQLDDVKLNAFRKLCSASFGIGSSELHFFAKIG